jgi:hypothetical protein
VRVIRKKGRQQWRPFSFMAAGYGLRQPHDGAQFSGRLAQVQGRQVQGLQLQPAGLAVSVFGMMDLLELGC